MYLSKGAAAVALQTLPIGKTAEPNQLEEDGKSGVRSWVWDLGSGLLSLTHA